MAVTSWSLWLLEKLQIQDVSEVCRLYQFHTSPMPKHGSMTTTIWTEWLQKFDCRMRAGNRHVLLITDNCPYLPIPKFQTCLMSKLCTYLLTPPVTHNLVKRRYQFHLLSKFIDCIDNHQNFKPRHTYNCQESLE